MACQIPESVLREALAGGASYAAIARTHGEDPAAVRARAIGLGLSRSRTQGRVPPEPILRIALGIDGVSQSRLAKAWGVHPDSITRAAKRLGIRGGRP